MHDHEGRLISAPISRRTALKLGAAAAATPALSALTAPPVNASSLNVAPNVVVDPLWPKPLPDKWITGEVAGNAVDSRDHVWTVNRRNLTETEQRAVLDGEGEPSPAVIEFDEKGDVVNAWTAPVMPTGLHGIFIDFEDNVWIAGNGDAIVQKYDMSGHLLMQIGTKNVFDTTNHSTTLLNRPSDVYVDPDNGEIYISDGYGNRRVIVFDRNGVFRRMWGEQGTVADAEAGAPYRFLQVVHSVNIGSDDLVYVSDRKGDRIHVYTKQGVFVRNIWVRKGIGWRRDAEFIALGLGASIGTAWDLDFSTDRAQTFIHNTDGEESLSWTIRRNASAPESNFGRPGHMPGEFTYIHTIAMDSKGNLYTAETVGGRRLQKFKAQGNRP
jgi:DNA-binding beta-propeller fold protein YncE